MSVYGQVIVSPSISFGHFVVCDDDDDDDDDDADAVSCVRPSVATNVGIFRIFG